MHLSIATALALRDRAVGAGLLCAFASWLRPEAYLYGLMLVVATVLTQPWRNAVRFSILGIGLVLGPLPWWS